MLTVLTQNSRLPMPTVLTQNSRIPRRSALSGDRMAFGFGYPHCSVPDARCQVSPGFLAKSVTCSRQIQPISQPLPNFSRATNYVDLNMSAGPESCAREAQALEIEQAVSGYAAAPGRRNFLVPHRAIETWLFGNTCLAHPSSGWSTMRSCGASPRSS